MGVKTTVPGVIIVRIVTMCNLRITNPFHFKNVNLKPFRSPTNSTQTAGLDQYYEWKNKDELHQPLFTEAIFPPN